MVRGLRTRRDYSENFKRKVATEYGSGSISKRDLCNKYNIGCPSSISRWYEEYNVLNSQKLSPKVVNLPAAVPPVSNESEELKKYKKRVRDLERLVSSKSLDVEARDMFLECWEEVVGSDVKKQVEELLLKKR